MLCQWAALDPAASSCRCWVGSLPNPARTVISLWSAPPLNPPLGWWGETSFQPHSASSPCTRVVGHYTLPWVCSTSLVLQSLSKDYLVLLQVVSPLGLQLYLSVAKGLLNRRSLNSSTHPSSLCSHPSCLDKVAKVSPFTVTQH